MKHFHFSLITIVIIGVIILLFSKAASAQTTNGSTKTVDGTAPVDWSNFFGNNNVPSIDSAAGGTGINYSIAATNPSQVVGASNLSTPAILGNPYQGTSGGLKTTYNTGVNISPNPIVVNTNPVQRFLGSPVSRNNYNYRYVSVAQGYSRRASLK